MSDSKYDVFDNSDLNANDLNVNDPSAQEKCTETNTGTTHTHLPNNKLGGVETNIYIQTGSGGHMDCVVDEGGDGKSKESRPNWIFNARENGQSKTSKSYIY